jgi:ribonucleoside-diphosphate reductase alpha chain
LTTDILTPTAKSHEARYTKSETYEASLAYFGGDELAASTFVSKYALKNPKIKANPFAELTPAHMHDRLATEVALRDVNFKFGTQYTNLGMMAEDHFRFFEEQFQKYLNAFSHFRYIVPQGSPMYGIGNPFVRVSISNCVVAQSPADNISGIMETGKELANLFKRRCGVGNDLSTLRPDGAAVSNSAGTSTGAWSFADYFSNVCRMIGQNGRRGALMLTLNVRHPDIDKFTVMKHDLTKVTGANVSVMLEDDFMEAVEAGSEWLTKWPVATVPELDIVECDVEDLMSKGGEWVEVPADHNHPLDSKVWQSSDPSERRSLRLFDARALWNLINDSACKTAEPGLLFWGNYTKNLPAHFYPQFKTICVNPCSEIGLSAYDSCRLTSLNLKNFVKNPYTTQAEFDFELFGQMTRLGMRVMDAIVEIEIEYLSNIINSVDDESERRVFIKLRDAAVLGRRTGLGTHALADALSALRLRYDSDEAMAMVERIFESFRNCAYDESVNLAIERGAFPAFDWELEKECAFIQRLPEWLQARIQNHGRRHISLLTMAPTGSVSIVSQTSSGIEPVFKYFYMRRKKVNPSDPDAKVDFTDQNGDKWEEFMVFHSALAEYLEIDAEAKAAWATIQEEKPKGEWASALSKILPDFFVQAEEIIGNRRVEIQGVIQRYIDHGISSTINLPKGTTTEQVAELYMNSWKHGLKGVTVYVDGSRTGVLVAADDKGKSGKPDSIVETQAPKRPKSLPCEIHHASIEGQKWTILVGLMDGKPYEVFGGLSENVVLPKRYTDGELIKTRCEKANANGRKSCYALVIGEGEDALVVKDIATAFNDGNYAWATRMLSTSLRHGVPIQFIVEQLRRDRISGLTSFSKVMARVLSKYVVDEETGLRMDFCKTGNCE